MKCELQILLLEIMVCLITENVIPSAVHTRCETKLGILYWVERRSIEGSLAMVFVRRVARRAHFGYRRKRERVRCVSGKLRENGSDDNGGKVG